jgi:hypothetical protein
MITCVGTASHLPGLQFAATYAARLNWTALGDAIKICLRIDFARGQEVQFA